MIERTATSLPLQRLQRKLDWMVSQPICHTKTQVGMANFHIDGA